MTTPKFTNSHGIWLFVVLMALLCVGYECRKGSTVKDAKVVATANVNDQQVIELKAEIDNLTDSIMIIRNDRDDLIKLIAAQESQLKKNKPNEAQILKTYQSLSDSAANAIFMQRYSKYSFFQRQD